MALTENEIRSIGKKAGQVILACEQRSTYVVGLIGKVAKFRDNMFSASVGTPERAKTQMLDYANNQAGWVRDTYPDGPVRQTILDGLENVKSVVMNSVLPVKEPVKELKGVLDAYGDIRRDLIRLMLSDFKECECGNAAAGTYGVHKSVSEKIVEAANKASELGGRLVNMGEDAIQNANFKDRASADAFREWVGLIGHDILIFPPGNRIDFSKQPLGITTTDEYTVRFNVE